MKYDWLIVGAGLFGSVVAYELSKRNYKILVIDKRNHIGGNVYTENQNDIIIGKYGCHIFHTSSKSIWDYINSFSEFNSYRHKVVVNYKNKIYSFPINLMTLNQLWGVITPAAAQIILESKKKQIENPKNLEEWALSHMGEELYEIFIRGYTEKQWQKPCNQLPVSIIKRIPIRLNYNDHYYHDNDIYEGVPTKGYTPIIEKMLENTEVKLEVDYFKDRNILNTISDNILYTGPIDKYYDYCYGELEYRSMRFEYEQYYGNYQGIGQMNYTDIQTPYNRIVEHKCFHNTLSNITIISKEYPQEYNNLNEPFYPINDIKNNTLYKQYQSLSNSSRIIFGGRLASYKYYDMDMAVSAALTLTKKI